ncbi:hypothetical protein VTO73DRAFT_15596 [Trametes versicolor]
MPVIYRSPTSRPPPLLRAPPQYCDECFQRIIEYERGATGRQEATVVHTPTLTIGSAKLMPNCVAPWDPNTFVDTLVLKDVEAISGEYRHHGNAVLIFEETGFMGQHLSAGIGQPVEPAEGEAAHLRGEPPSEPLGPPPSVNSVVMPRPPTPRPTPDIGPLEPYPHPIPRTLLQGLDNPYVVRIPAASISYLAEAAVRRLEEMETERLRLVEEARALQAQAAMGDQHPSAMEEGGQAGGALEAPPIDTLPEAASGHATEEERDELADTEAPGEPPVEPVGVSQLTVSRASSTDPQPPDSVRQTPEAEESFVPRYALREREGRARYLEHLDEPQALDRRTRRVVVYRTDAPSLALRFRERADLDNLLNVKPQLWMARERAFMRAITRQLRRATAGKVGYGEALRMQPVEMYDEGMVVEEVD